MTRFYTDQSSSTVWTRLQQALKKLGYEYKNSLDKVCVCVCACVHHVFSSQVSLVVTTVDRRKQPLVFKASVYELRQDLLLIEFRRSKVRAK